MDRMKTSWEQFSPWTQSMLIGAGLTAVLSSSYLGISYCCCLGVIAGSVLAVQQYASRTEQPVDMGDGLTLGVVSALLGGVLVTAVEFTGQLVGLGTAAGIQQVIPTSLGVADRVDGWDVAGEVVWFIVGLGVRLILYPVMGLIGGILGAVIFQEE